LIAISPRLLSCCAQRRSRRNGISRLLAADGDAGSDDGNESVTESNVLLAAGEWSLCTGRNSCASIQIAIAPTTSFIKRRIVKPLKRWRLTNDLMAAAAERSQIADRRSPSRIVVLVGEVIGLKRIERAAP
jgi:hypothetical protein